MKRINRINRINWRIALAMSLIVVAAMIPRPASSQEPMTGWVGVAYTTGVGQSDREGMLVFKDYPVIESIEPNSPAERAGLEAGDTILAMNAQDLRRSPLPGAAMVQPGRRIVFRFKRANTVREVTVTVVPRPRNSPQTLVVTMLGPPDAPGSSPGSRELAITRRDKIAAEVASRVPRPIAVLPPIALGFPRSLAVAGAELTALNEGLKSLVGLNVPGIFVVNVAVGTPASESGLHSGDVILRAATFPVRDPGDLIRLLSESTGSSIRLQVMRNKKPQTITLRW